MIQMHAVFVTLTITQLKNVDGRRMVRAIVLFAKRGVTGQTIAQARRMTPRARAKGATTNERNIKEEVEIVQMRHNLHPRTLKTHLVMSVTM